MTLSATSPRAGRPSLIIGAVAGDMIGSPYEANPIKTTDFPLFHSRSRYTDDSVLTWATMDALLHGKSYTEVYQAYARRYPYAGYGGAFRAWMEVEEPVPYNSWGNGSAMRVSPVGWACDSLESVIAEARRSAEVTHDHPEGIKGACALAVCVWMGRVFATKEEIRDTITRLFGYDLDRSIADIRPGYEFDVSCQGSVPEAIIAFLESTDFESAVRLAVSLGGDSDTLGCMAGAIAEAYYGPVPEPIAAHALARVPAAMRDIMFAFADRYGSRLAAPTSRGG